jgi:hypothetical protein
MMVIQDEGRTATEPEHGRAPHGERTRTARGVLVAILLALPLWALIALTARALWGRLR